MRVPGRWIFAPPISSGFERIACPGVSLVTRRSPTAIAPYRASTLTFTRPLWATFALSSPPSPSRIPGFCDTTPATRSSYAFLLTVTRFESPESMITTVPGGRFRSDLTHSATSGNFAAKYQDVADRVRYERQLPPATGVIIYAGDPTRLPVSTIAHAYSVR